MNDVSFFDITNNKQYITEDIYSDESGKISDSSIIIYPNESKELYFEFTRTDSTIEKLADFSVELNIERIIGIKKEYPIPVFKYTSYKKKLGIL